MRRTIICGAAALVSLASALPAWAQFDGIYNGQVQCGPSGGQRVPVGTVRITVAGTGFTYEVQVTGGGVERGTGDVTPPSISGGGSGSGGGWRYDSSYSGQIAPGTILMSGEQTGTFTGGASGGRQCSMSARRG
ncbi:MAG: hypothetical protein JO055_01395 [Alphaproteobacteria bacterium]|nr:hypothetical protein [Alphaproteobacteria bacterium]